MPFSAWMPGVAVSSPAYLDSGVVIAAFVRRDTRYQKAARLLGELLAAQIHILVSTLTLSESLWGIAKLSYCEIHNHPSRVTWNPDIYRRNHADIFAKHGQRMNSVHDWIRDWLQVGVNVDVVPVDTADFRVVTGAAPQYMQAFQLSSADATHLATAERRARSFITTDSEFQRAATSSLEIFVIGP
jgi:predicted nucleic acid-binding protein